MRKEDAELSGCMAVFIVIGVVIVAVITCFVIYLLTI